MAAPCRSGAASASHEVALTLQIGDKWDWLHGDRGGQTHVDYPAEEDSDCVWAHPIDAHLLAGSLAVRQSSLPPSLPPSSLLPPSSSLLPPSFLLPPSSSFLPPPSSLLPPPSSLLAARCSLLPPRCSVLALAWSDDAFAAPL
jgi:hypothetical protein